MNDRDQRLEGGVRPQADVEQALEADSIAEDEHEQQERVQITQSFRIQSTEGPLPSPEDTKQYEQILPGFADRHVKIVEKEQDNRHENDRRAYELAVLEVRESSKRLVIQRVASLLMLTIIGIFAVLLALIGNQPEIGGGIIIAEVVGIALNSVWSRRPARSGDDNGA
ncbi:MAG: DUF2335 domain-containing protein [Chloroflexi bacterium]|nr:DUF2335 domain-containing protein [Chloroflexota bacterium]MYD74286.1 DUF2335 domain-containing protein [Chloroflexota bacterium]